MKKFFDILKINRKKLSLTQKELANKLKMPQSHLSKIENGQVDLRLPSLFEITSYLGLSIMIVPTNKKNIVNSIIYDNDYRKPMYNLENEDE